MSMASLISSTLGALEVAASLSGIPGLSVAATLLREIADVCQQVSVNKTECRGLSDKCAQLLLAYSEQTSRLEGSELLQHLDQVTDVMQKVLRRVRRWANYGYAMSIVRKGKIESGLHRCQAEVDIVLKVFDINSAAIMHQNQRVMQENIGMNQHQLLELLEDLRSNQEQLNRVVQRQEAGENIVEPLMKAGQNELRVMRTRFAEQPSVSDARSTERYAQYEETLLGLHRATGIPPSIKRLDGEVTRQGGIPFTGGLYYDVFLGTWLGGEKVALKALRGIIAKERIRMRFEREIEFWAKLNHRNILPFYGIVTNIGQQIHMVSPWQSNGNLLDYVKKNPDANQHALLHGAAAGLSYLHSRSIVHGNDGSSKMLQRVDLIPEARICDFGMSKIMEEVTEISASKTLTSEGSARYVAPELIGTDDQSTTMRSDVYSFAMLILECVSQKPPFAHLRRDAAVILAVVNKGQHPGRPDGAQAHWITDDLWQVMIKCWSGQPSARPTMEQVSEFLASLLN